MALAFAVNSDADHLGINAFVISPEPLKVAEDGGSGSQEPGHVSANCSVKATNIKKKNGVLLKLAILLAIIVISALVYKTGVFKLFLTEKKILDFLDSLGPLSFVGFIVLQAAQVVLAPIPGEVTGLIGGFTYGPFWGVILSTTGLVIGSFLAFSLSRTFGRPFVEKFVSQSTMDRFDYLLHHKGLFLIFMLFLLPGFPKDYLCLILGLGHLTTMEFLVISSVGRFMGTVLLTLGGGYIRYHEYEKLLVLVGVAACILLVALLFRSKLEGILKALHIRNNGKNLDHPDGEPKNR